MSESLNEHFHHHHRKVVAALLLTPLRTPNHRNVGLLLPPNDIAAASADVTPSLVPKASLARRRRRSGIRVVQSQRPNAGCFKKSYASNATGRTKSRLDAPEERRMQRDPTYPRAHDISFVLNEANFLNRLRFHKTANIM